MADPAQKEDKSPPEASNEPIVKSGSTLSTLSSRIGKRQSRELVIALSGPIGSGVHTVREQLELVLKDEGYQVHVIRISELIKRFFKDSKITDQTINTSSEVMRYQSLMDAGDTLRKKHDLAICAMLASNEISHIRAEHENEKKTKKPDDNNLEGKNSSGLIKRVFIVDQLKHPEEIKYLKKIYSGIFYQIGVLCDEQRREVSLTTNGMDRRDAHGLIDRDRKNNENHEQQLEKALTYADFFINNSDPNSSSIASLFSRFLKLLHGGRGVTPTQQEIGMYSAFSASMQSACLSRQVGASILDGDGMVLAIGRNDVPRFGGGLYTEDDNVSPNSKDYRCVHRDQQCHNDLHKSILKTKVQRILEEALKKYPDIDKVALAQLIHDETPIKSLIEYSRAIHAEMDALISLVRNGKSISKSATLYTTTYPCHNCARHIIAAGIEKVIYIEPYEKSLAIKLHDDALSHGISKDKVSIIPFQGIAPRRFQVFFTNTTPDKDKSGRIIRTDKENLLQVDQEFVDSYLEREVVASAEVLKFINSEKTVS